MSQDKMLDHALAYAERGWKVFPVHSFIDGLCTCDDAKCHSPAKHPLNDNGCNGATLDPELIREWHGDTKGLCNWGIATGERSGLWVLDVDPRHGGDVTLAQLEAQHGQLPLTPTVATGGGGKQFYFRLPAGVKISSKAGILPGLDTRGEGGYIITPPSLHASGQRYACRTPPETSLAEAPGWLLELVRSEKLTPQAKATVCSLREQTVGMNISPGNRLTLTVGVGTPDLTNSPGVGEGVRNATLCKLVGVHLARAEGLEQVEALALEWAAKCEPPYQEGKTLDTVRRLWRGHQAKREGSTDTTATHPTNAGQKAGREGTNSIPGPMPSGLGISFLPPQAERPGGVASVGSVEPQSPTLHANAYQGLAGQIIKALAPETEADPVGVLLSLLTGFGNAVGHSPHFHAGDIHHANLFTVLVGKTSAAKGMAVSDGLLVVQKADPEWATDCMAYGLGSGEGLVERVRDAQINAESLSDGTGRVTGFRANENDAGVQDKRLLVLEEEFAKVVTLLRRENTTLSQHVKNAWDGKPLEVLNRGKNRLKATGHHLGILASITPEELAHCFSKGTATKDGFANRFLWPLVKRSKSLPHGGNRSVVPFIKRLAEVLVRSRTIGEMKRSDEANGLWETHYERLVQVGDQATACERARPQTLRLSMVYALLDGSAIIQVEHLRAALAVWDYCEASARLIFGAGVPQTNTPPQEEPLAMRLLNAITNRPGISRTGLREVAGHNVKVEEIETALAWLEAQGLSHRGECGDGPGRRAECWWPGPKPPSGPGTNAGTRAWCPLLAARARGTMPWFRHGRREEGNNSSPSPMPEFEAICSLPPPTPVAGQGEGTE